MFSALRFMSPLSVPARLPQVKVPANDCWRTGSGLSLPPFLLSIHTRPAVICLAFRHTHWACFCLRASAFATASSVCVVLPRYPWLASSLCLGLRDPILIRTKKVSPTHDSLSFHPALFLATIFIYPELYHRFICIFG